MKSIAAVLFFALLAAIVATVVLVILDEIVDYEDGDDE